MTVVIILCLIYMGGLLAWNVFRLTKCTRKERLKRLKNFKNGKFALIYAAVIPLFFLANRFNGATADGAFWLSVRACFETVVLMFDYKTVSALAAENLLYRIAVDLLFSLVVVNAVMFTLSLCGQRLLNAVSLWLTKRFRKKVVVVVGDGDSALTLLSSVQKKRELGKAVLVGEMSPARKDEAFLRKADYIPFSADDNLGKKLGGLLKNLTRRRVSVILDCGNNEADLICMRQLFDACDFGALGGIPLTDTAGLGVYVFGSKESEAIFAHYVERSMGIVHFVDRHMQIATDFMDRYPLTRYMTDEIDISSATLRANLEVNVVMVGFGKLNESLFLTSVANNQFLVKQGEELCPKAVHYHLFDRYYPEGRFTKEDSVLSGGLHYGYFRYEEFLAQNKGKEDEYLEFVPPPADVHVHAVEVSHPSFYRTLRPVFSAKNGYTYVIISYGSDLENIELGRKLQQKIREWECSSFIKIFVKVRNGKLTKQIEDDFEMTFFGSEDDCVYNAEVILNEKAERMAKLRHLLYTAEYETGEVRRQSEGSLADKDIEEKARNQWYREFKQFQRESNLFACLSLRMKLHLCGFDYTDDPKACDCAEEFEAVYEKDDKRMPSDIVIDGKRMWRHDNAEQFRPSLRWALTVQEHQRWCAGMIANGVVPSDRKEICSPSRGKRLDKRMHGNITTMRGLVEFRDLTAKTRGKTDEQTDVIRYDYQLMDDAVWLLHACGYKIVHKESAKKEEE